MRTSDGLFGIVWSKVDQLPPRDSFWAIVGNLSRPFDRLEARPARFFGVSSDEVSLRDFEELAELELRACSRKIYTSTFSTEKLRRTDDKFD